MKDITIPQRPNTQSSLVFGASAAGSERPAHSVHLGSSPFISGSRGVSLHVAERVLNTEIKNLSTAITGFSRSLQQSSNENISPRNVGKTILTGSDEAGMYTRLLPDWRMGGLSEDLMPNGQISINYYAANRTLGLSSINQEDPASNGKYLNIHSAESAVHQSDLELNRTGCSTEKLTSNKEKNPQQSRLNIWEDAERQGLDLKYNSEISGQHCFTLELDPEGNLLLRINSTEHISWWLTQQQYLKATMSEHGYQSFIMETPNCR